MSEHRFIRRNRVDERLATAIGVASGFVAILSPASPTGSTVTDAIILFVAVAATSWASASAPWWSIAVLGGVAAIIAFSPIPGVLGFLAFLGGLHVGLFRRNDSELRSVIGAIGANVLLWSRLDGFFGLSAIIGIGLCTTVVFLAIRRRPSRVRRSAWTVVTMFAIAATVALIGVAVAASSSRNDVTNAATAARRAVRSLDGGDYVEAARLFEQASAGFDRGADQLEGPLALPGTLIPGLAQNATAGRELSAVAANSTAEAAAALRQVDPKTLTLSEGRIDLEAVTAVEAPLVRVQNSLKALADVSERVDSPWLVGPLQNQLADLKAELTDNEPQLNNAIDAVRIAPDLLGINGERRYLVLFTSPSEARGLGGLVGNYAEMTIDNGAIVVSAFGRTTDLNKALRAGSADCSACPDEFLENYGKYGFTSGDDGGVGDVAWSNITMPSDFPLVAQTASVLYPQSGGKPIDGVIVMDPYVVAALMQYTGPIAVPELDTVVTSGDAAEFLLVDQYVFAQELQVRVEALETLGIEAITKFLATTLPDPAALAQQFGPLIEERRLLMWTDDAIAQDVLDRVGLLGAIPPLDASAGGFSVSVTNASGNKIDSFLERTTEVTNEINDDGTRRLVAHVSLTNNSPVSGLPPYVIGNQIDLPDGWSRLIVTFYGPPSLVDATLDSEPINTSTFREAGWIGERTVLELAPGQTAEYRMDFVLPVDDDSFYPSLWEQPLAR